MDISNYIDLSQLLVGNMLAIEYEVQSIFQHEIMVEASAAKTREQKNSLQDLLSKARVVLDYDSTSVHVNLYFLEIPEGMENYADMIVTNASTVITPIIKETISDCLNMEDARNKVFDMVKNVVLEQVRDALGGVL